MRLAPGVLRLVVTPTFDGRAVGGRVARQGSPAVHTNSLLYSAVAVTPAAWAPW